MSVKNLKTQSKTDWARIDQMTDEEIDTSDSPPLDDDFFAKAEWRMPKKKTAVTLSVDSEVLKWFEGQGADFQHRVNAALKIYAEAHQE
ncbi:MAG: BrnA antitoxin family protein [Acidobacteriota bacterium]|nr:BrnA antitoxin family protein [Acidobacteriota bacterium]